MAFLDYAGLTRFKDKMDQLIASSKGIFFVESTQESASSAWEGDLHNVDELYDGLTIAYYLTENPQGSVEADVTLTLSLDSGTDTGAIPVYVDATNRMRKQYPQGSIIYLTYYDDAWRHSNSPGNSGTHGLYFVNGTQQSSTNAWTGSIATLDELTDGIVIFYRLPYDSSGGDVTLTLTLSDGNSGAIPVYYTGNSRLTTEYGAGSIIPLVYYNSTWRGADFDSGTDSEGSAAQAAVSALEAEGYAKGTQGGTPVTSGNDYYQDNAKYYKEAAETASDIAQAAAATASAAYNVNIIAPNYSDLTFPVAIGTPCIYDGGYYTANTTIQSQEEWTAAHWTQRTVGGNIAALQQQLSAITDGYVVSVESNQDEDGIVITYNNGTSTEIAISSMAFDGGYVEDGELHLTLDGEDIEDYEPILLPEPGMSFDGGYCAEDPEDGKYYLHLTKEGEELDPLVFTPIEIVGGGGGGGGSSNILLTNVVRVMTIRNGNDAVFGFTATASDDTDITVVWYVDNVEISRETNISGSSFRFNAGSSLQPSSVSVVKAVITSVGGGSLTRPWSVTSTPFALSWGASIQPITLYTTNENVYVVIDVEAQARTSNIVTVTVGQHEREQTVVGSRSLTLELNKSWFESGANTVTAVMTNGSDETDTSDPISFIAMWGYGAEGPMVAFAHTSMNGKMYEPMDIQYLVYDPSSETANCTIQIGEESPRSIVADRTMRTFTYVPQEEGTVTVELVCDEVSDQMTLVIAENDRNINKVTGDSLRYDLDPVGHTNEDADRNQFAGLTFSSGFDWVNGGFQTDEDGAQAFVVKKGSTATLPRSLFEDSDANGKVIDVSFKVTNSDLYNAVAMQDMNVSNTKGLILRANEGELRLDNAAGQIFKYCEDSRVDLSILVEDAVSQRVVTIWLDGIPSKVDPYEASMLVSTESDLVIGSEHCDVWVYAIRCYNAKMSIREMIQNYISLGSTIQDKYDRYADNDIYDANDKITPASLHAAAPNLTIIEIEADRMTTNKKDKVPANISITDGTDVLNLYSADGTVFMVQGTSSAAYGRSSYNLDIDFKNTGETYKISPTSIPVNYLNVKVNVASSENANNVNAVDWYNTYQPYKIEADTRAGVRDVIEAKPCAVFIKNTNTNAVWFSSQLAQPGETILYAMGDLCNSKKNSAVFGQDGVGTHPTMACVEVSGNDTAPQRFETDQSYMYDSDEGAWRTFNGYDDQGNEKWTTHFEWRMEPSSSNEYTAVTAWENAVSWVVSTIGNSTKFKNEVGNYFAIDSLLYHFLMLEFMAAYDNVSKNTFYSYDWDEDASKYLWNIKKAYDWDTIIAADNDGKPFGDYGIDYGDTIDGTVSGRSYFNAVTNTIWTNIKAAFQSELSAMYIELRTQGAWDALGVIEKWDTYQSKRPHAAMAQDAYTKYIEPYKTNNVIINNETRGYDDSYLSRMQGSKTYWRRQFMTYQQAYMDGKYGYYSTSSAIAFRTNCASGVEDFAIKCYAKTYITAMADANKVGSQKIATGGTFTFEDVSVGSNTTIYFMPARLIQYIRPLNETDNSTFVAGGAIKLTEAILGSENENTAWPSTEGLSVPSALLEDLSVRNMVNFSSALNLSSNVSLKTLDTRGTNTGRVTLPSYAPLTSIQLNACTGLVAMNLSDVETFTMASGENLLSIRMENCNSVMMDGILDYLEEATGLQYLRMTDVDWTLDDTSLLNRLLSVGSISDSGVTGAAPCILTGDVYVPTLRSSEKAKYDAAWPDLNVTYTTFIPQYQATFVNWDGNPILDLNGNPYIQYVDASDYAYDPITEGEVLTPTKPTDEAQSYTFGEWSGIGTAFFSDRTITATFTSSTRTFTVEWYMGAPIGNEGVLLKRLTNVSYGSSVSYGSDPPKFTDQESIRNYYVFNGWDKSTGYIRPDPNASAGEPDTIKVHAQWIAGSLPEPADSPGLAAMNWAQRYGVAQLTRATRSESNPSNRIKASDYWDLDEHMDFTLGHGDDMEFSNVESETLISTPTYFDGTTAPMIFNGEGGLPSIQLFNGDIDRFTLAIDYEFTSDSGVLASCFDDNGNEGFQFRRYGYYGNVLWGNNQLSVGYQYQRGVFVLRYNRGQYPLILYVTHDGNTSGLKYPIDTSHPDTNVTLTSIVRSVSTTTDAPLTFGGVGYANGQDVTSLRGTGWIHWAKIWYDDIGADNAALICAMPHIPMRFSYTGIEYRDGLSSATTVAAGFQSVSPLPLKGRINYTSTNIGGWAASHLRSWLNGQFFDGLPFPVRSIICEARVRSTEGGGSSSSHALNPSNSMDKVYLPAYAEVFSYVTGNDADNTAYISECDDLTHRIPEYVYDSSKGQTGDDNTRNKFPGIVLGDDANWIVGTSDPTTPSFNSTVHSEKTVWVRSDDWGTGWIYLNADFISKHKFFCGITYDDSSNILSAVGADSDGGTGGKWVKASDWWHRSPDVTNNANFRHSGSNGSAYSSIAAYTTGILPAFSI